jgi:hypothetical protein
MRKNRIVVDDWRTLPRSTIYKTLETAAEGLYSTWHQYYDAAGKQVDELWLDFDLGESVCVDREAKEVVVRNDTTEPIVHWLVRIANLGQPFPVKSIRVHTSLKGVAYQMIDMLHEAGYSVSRGYIS